MTTLWEQQIDDTCYSVRSAGASVRLYSNRVFHSQWNPDRPFAGGVWDLLGLPVLYRPAEAIQRVLLLGVGGGAVIRQLEQLVPDAHVTAIEIDPIHIEVAKRWFGVGDSSATTLIEADAVAWVRACVESPYDLIIDDLFGHDAGEPVRAQPMTPDWVAALRDLTSDGGLVVVNCVDGRELSAAAPVFIDEGLNHASRWTQSGYENAIGVFADAPLVPREWSRRLESLALETRSERSARATVRRPLRAGQQSSRS